MTLNERFEFGRPAIWSLLTIITCAPKSRAALINPLICVAAPPGCVPGPGDERTYTIRVAPSAQRRASAFSPLFALVATAASNRASSRLARNRLFALIAASRGKRKGALASAALFEDVIRPPC